MKITIQHIFLAGTLVFLSACGSGGSLLSSSGLSLSNATPVVREEVLLESPAYQKSIEDKEHGFTTEKTIGDFTFMLQYKPHEYIISKEEHGRNLSAAELKKKIHEIDGLQYYNFRIKAKDQNLELLKIGANTDEEYQKRISYFSYRMQNDLQLVDGTDTLNCALFHFERIYGTAPYSTFSLGFPAGHSPANNGFTKKTLIYEDNVFGLGTINLSLELDKIELLPKLQTL